MPADRPPSRPSPWSRRRFLGAGAALAAAGLVGCSLEQSSSPDPSAESDTAGGWSGSVVDPPFERPDVTFTDADGNDFPFLERTEGRLSIVFFGYTNCPDICPVYLQTLARAREDVSGPGGKPQVLFVGVDRARDTPEVLKTYLANIDPTFIGLTASEAIIAEAVTSVQGGVIEIGEPEADGSYLVGHPAWGTVYSPEDGLGHRRYPFGIRQAEWVRDLPRLAEGEYR